MPLSIRAWFSVRLLTVSSQSLNPPPSGRSSGPALFIFRPIYLTPTKALDAAPTVRDMQHHDNLDCTSCVAVISSGIMQSGKALLLHHL